MLLQFLQEENVYYGTYTGQVDIDAVEKKLRDTYPFLTWVSLRVQGTRLYVSVRENDQLLLQEETEQRPCDLIATMDGAGIDCDKGGDSTCQSRRHGQKKETVWYREKYLFIMTMKR